MSDGMSDDVCRVPDGGQPPQPRTDQPRMELLPPHALLEVARVLTTSSKGSREPGRLVGEAQRHINAWQRGEDDLPHLAHAVASLCEVIELLHHSTGRAPTSGWYSTKRGQPLPGR